MYINKYNGWLWHVGGFIQGIASILDGVVMAGSFGFCGLGAQLFVARHRARLAFEIQKQRALAQEKADGEKTYTLDEMKYWFATSEGAIKAANYGHAKARHKQYGCSGHVFPKAFDTLEEADAFSKKLGGQR